MVLEFLRIFVTPQKFTPPYSTILLSFNVLTLHTAPLTLLLLFIYVHTLLFFYLLQLPTLLSFFHLYVVYFLRGMTPFATNAFFFVAKNFVKLFQQCYMNQCFFFFKYALIYVVEIA